MDIQKQFLEPDPPYQPHSETSRQAAEQILPSTATLRGKVFAFIAGCQERGATDDEMQVALGMEGSTQRPRRVELQNQGLIIKASATRKTRKGREAAVWVCKEV